MIQQETTAAEIFLYEILNEKIEELSQQQLQLMQAHRNFYCEKLLPILKQEVNQYLETEEKTFSPYLYWSMELLAFFKEPQAFQWILKLCSTTPEEIDEALGEYFSTEILSSILAKTAAGRWKELQHLIENPEIDIIIRSICLTTCLYMIVDEQLDRMTVVNYFKKLLDAKLNLKTADHTLITELVTECADLWPDECMEMIRELFGLGLVDTQYINLDDVIEHLNRGKEDCLEKIKKQFQKHQFPLIDSHTKHPEISQESLEKMEKIEKLAKQRDRFAQSNNKANSIGRNDPCHCGSEKKYKKCCIDKKDNIAGNTKQLPKGQIENFIISFDPVPCKEMQALSEEEQDEVHKIKEMVEIDPYLAATQAKILLMQYPDLPPLYNYLYNALKQSDNRHEAMKILKETIVKFPNYLFGLIEYGNYYLRRGEPEKITEIFRNCYTLKQLYPNREVFHISEFSSFCYLMGEYFIAIDNIQRAETYLEILQNIIPKEKITIKFKKLLGHRIFQKEMRKILYS